MKTGTKNWKLIGKRRKRS